MTAEVLLIVFALLLMACRQPSTCIIWLAWLPNCCVATAFRVHWIEAQHSSFIVYRYRQGKKNSQADCCGREASATGGYIASCAAIWASQPSFSSLLPLLSESRDLLQSSLLSSTVKREMPLLVKPISTRTCRARTSILQYLFWNQVVGGMGRFFF